MNSNTKPNRPPSGGLFFASTSSSNELEKMASSIFTAFNQDMREAWEERSGVREFDGGLPRPVAEFMALVDVANLDHDEFIAVLLAVHAATSASYMKE